MTYVIYQTRSGGNCLRRLLTVREALAYADSIAPACRAAWGSGIIVLAKTSMGYPIGTPFATHRGYVSP